MCASGGREAAEMGRPVKGIKGKKTSKNGSGVGWEDGGH